MIENVSAADEFLYHYTKVSTALNYILKDRSLRLGRYNTTEKAGQIYFSLISNK